MALTRRSVQRMSGSIWPGFVDAMTALLLVLMFVLSIFMIVQFVLSETLNDFLQDASRLEANPTGQAGQGQGRTGGRSGRTTSEFVVVPDVETNSLLIAASRTRYEELLALIQRLDRRRRLASLYRGEL